MISRTHTNKCAASTRNRLSALLAGMVLITLGSAPAQAADPELLTTTPLVDFGTVCSPGLLLHQIETRPYTIFYPPVSFLGRATVTSITVSGPGFSLISPPTVPFNIFSSTLLTYNVAFTPVVNGPVSGAITISTSDTTKPPLVIQLAATGRSNPITVVANTLKTPTLTFGSVTTWTVTIRNQANIGCYLHSLPSISGTGGTWQVVLPSSYFFNGRLIKDIEVPPGGANSDLIVKFTSSITTRTSKAVGTLVLNSNDLANPVTSVTFGAEVVAPGLRVLVVSPDGTPYRAVDNISVKSVKGKVNEHGKDVPLTTIEPPESWKTIQYHYWMDLNPVESTDYEVRVQIGNRRQALTVTVTPGEFKDLMITLP